MTTRIIAEERLNHPQTQTAFRRVKLLVGCYLGLSILTLVAIILLRNNTAIVIPAVWIRGTIVAASALLTTFFVTQMVRGSKQGYFRLRLVSAIMFVAIVVIIALPGLFPLWMKIEQGVCGLLLLGVVVIVNGKHLQSTFATK
ncbi:hypothetical protein [Tengunoibacter tsumagoiensis]|uniref:Uncharacterized protein n=1 Tax=Tengunoibacter tsumagoiensis TaxID=2014871 RepID=A0A401ZYA6_9CHLR|nr:hypothetical protein [Tengunoibacter tsumagoiensis]GCE11813.1 hypothetical protein KTT_16720 [Tengunoibacter tsumagoiensis]